MKKFWKYSACALGYFAVFLLLQFWVSLAGAFFCLAVLGFREGAILLSSVEAFIALYLDTMGQYLTVIILVSNLVTVLVFWLFFRCRGKPFCREIGLRKTSWKNILLAVPYGIGMCFTVDLILNLLPLSRETLEVFAENQDMLWDGNAAITFLSVALVGPVSEEICFRGLCYTRLKKGMRPVLAGLISAVFFGLAHGNPVWILVGLLAGSALAWIFETTGSLWCAITVHVVNNAISSLSAYFPLSEPIYFGLVGASVLLLGISAYFIRRLNPRNPEQAPVLQE